MKIVVSFFLMIVVENKLIIAKKTVDHCSIKQCKNLHMMRYEESLIFDEEKKLKNCGRPEGGSEISDTPGRGGEGGQKRANFCGRPLWMAPYLKE
jgi:hypothetical protein